MCSQTLKENIKLKLSDVLHEEFTHPTKRQVRDKGNHLLMACPICGDSHKDHTKQRGYFYFDTMKYHCFNGDCIAKYWGALYFFKRLGISVGNTDHIKEIGEIMKNTRRSRAHMTLQNSSEYFKFLHDNSIRLDKIIKSYGLRKWNSYDWSKQFIKDRLLSNKKDELYFRVNKWKKREVWILNTIGDDKVVGLQIKNMDGGPKYLTKDFSKLHEELGYDTEFTDETFRGVCDNLSLIFNIFNVNLEAPVTVFEGPIDSFFFRNSVATAGATKIKEFFDDLDNIRYFYDNDQTGKKNAMEKLKKGLPAFLWKKFFQENKYKNKRLKDLNELISHVYENRELSSSINNLSKYFGKTKYDIYYV